MCTDTCIHQECWADETQNPQAPTTMLIMPIFTPCFSASLPSHSLRSSKGISLLVLRVNGCQSISLLWPFYLEQSPAACMFNHLRHISLTGPFSHRHRHTRGPIDVTEMLQCFCCWTLIWLSCHWAWLCQWCWCYRNLIDWLINWKAEFSHVSPCYQTCSLSKGWFSYLFQLAIFWSGAFQSIGYLKICHLAIGRIPLKARFHSTSLGYLLISSYLYLRTSCLCFLDFAVEHWFGCRTTEPGFTGDIGAIDVCLIDWLIDWFNLLLIIIYTYWSYYTFLKVWLMYFSSNSAILLQ